jgi:steroid delta-isomerase-like uncharacterized protein
MRSSLLLLVVVLAGCSADKVVRPEPPPVDWQSLHAQPPSDVGVAKATAKERLVAQRYLYALTSPGFAQVRPMLAEDAHFFSGSADLRGREQVVKAHDELFGAFDNRHFFPNRVFRTDRSQALEWTLTGVQARAWKGVAPTGKTVTFRGLTLLWTNDDGSVSDVHIYFDPAVVKAQLGVGSAELRKLPPSKTPTMEAQVLEQAGASQEAANVAVARAMLQALEDRAEPAYLSAVANDVEISTLDRAEPARGREAAARLFRAMHRSIGDLDTVVQNAWGVQDFAIVEYSISGLQVAPLGRMPFVPSRLLHIQGVDVAEIHDGKITQIWRYDDSGVLASPEQTAQGGGPRGHEA